MPDPAQHTVAELQARGPLPEHIAVIMDGNGRWARQKGLPRVEGHRQGVHSVRDVTEACAELGVPHLTLYTFSTENWNRPKAEVSALMKLLINALRREAQTFQDNNIRLTAIGDIGHLPAQAQEELESLMEDTSGNERMTLTLALSYSGQWDLTNAMQAIGRAIRDGRLEPESITAEGVASHLSTFPMPDPDLLVRTGGEQRISNFMLWQLAYTELHFSPVYWPDFRRQHLFDAISDFQDRERRFGRVLSPQDE
ncbi:MAG: isoprenyl transferase [Bacteroidetes bacterium]|nr:isoprenyl transferase [Bacteroidota bacterium]MDA0874138.1 isoprenyl transferase [Bacteroidota bacterium]